MLSMWENPYDKMFIQRKQKGKILPCLITLENKERTTEGSLGCRGEGRREAGLRRQGRLQPAMGRRGGGEGGGGWGRGTHLASWPGSG